MKKVYIFLLLAFITFSAFVLTSCDKEKDPQGDLLPKTNFELFSSAVDELSSFAYDVHAAGTDITTESIKKIIHSDYREDTAELKSIGLTVFDREMISEERNISFTSKIYTDRVGDKSISTSKLNAGDSSVSIVSYSNAEETLIQLPGLSDSYLKVQKSKDVYSVINKLSSLLTSENIKEDLFTKTAVDYIYQDELIRNTTELTLDLSAFDIASLVGIDAEVNDLKIITYFNGEEFLGCKITSEIDSDRFVLDLTMKKTADTLSLNFDIVKNEVKTVIFEFNQVIGENGKSGIINVTNNLLQGDTDKVKYIKIESVFETSVNGNSQVCEIMADVEYELYGLVTEYTMPVHIYTDISENALNCTVSLSFTNSEITNAKAQLSTTFTVAEPKDVPFPDVEDSKKIDITDSESFKKYLDQSSSMLFMKYPSLYYLINGQKETSIHSLDNQARGEQFILYSSLYGKITNPERVSTSGTGAYSCKFTYSYSSADKSKITVSEPGRSQYLLNLTQLNADGNVYTDEHSRTWILFEDGTGRYSENISFEATAANDGNWSITVICVYDGRYIFRDAKLAVRDSVWTINNIPYDYNIY